MCTYTVCVEYVGDRETARERREGEGGKRTRERERERDREREMPFMKFPDVGDGCWECC